MIRRTHSESGFALVESLVAVGILGMALVVFLGGMSTGLLSTSQSDRLSTAHELARSQMEFTKAEAYAAAPHTYTSVTAPATFGVTSEATSISGGDANIQQISVQVTKDGVVVYSLDGYKVNR